MFKSIRAYVSWLWDNSRGVHGTLLVYILAGCLSIGLNLYFIWLSKHLVDMATGDVPSGGHSALVWTSVLIVVIMLARIGVNAFNSRLEQTTTSRMSFIMRQRLYNSLLQSQWEGKEKMHSGDTLNRLFSDVDMVTRTICQDFPSFFTTVVQLIAAFIFLATMKLDLALCLIIVTPLLLLFGKIFFRQMRQMTRDIRQTESRIQSHIQETIQHKTVIQSLEQSGMMEDQLDSIQKGEFSQILRRTNFNVFSRTIISIVFSGGYVAALLWGVFGIAGKSVTFGMLTAFLQLVGQIQRPAVNLTRQIPQFAYATASIDRLRELEDAPREETGKPVRLKGQVGVRVENLSFHYPDGTDMVFEGFSHDFRPGSKTAIIGRTGVGKSTLIRLMLSLLRPTGGRIVLYGDGTEAEASSRTRVNIVYVPQGNTLFSGTIRDNLLMGNPDATDEELWKALGTAVADGFVRDLPDGIDTVCGEMGSGLSEGQAQRIAIARGLLRPGCLMLLDEFSSSLDSSTEEKLMNNLTAEDDGKTMIFITHREKIAEYCSDILKL